MSVAANLGNIASSLKGVERSTITFRQSASESNRNISKFAKDISNIFQFVRRELSGLGNSIQSSSDNDQQNATKLETNNSLLQESIAIQNSMLSEIRKLRKDISGISGKEEGGILQSLSDVAKTAGATKLISRFAGGAGLAVGGAAALGAGYMMSGGNRNQGAQLTPPVQFSGTEEQKVDAILSTIKGKESGGRYGVTSFAEGRGSTASGGYQFTDSTWRRYASKYGVDVQQFPRAKDAPPEVQDAVARAAVKEILVQVKGDVSKVPLVWYTGNPQGRMSENALRVNRGLTGEQYQADWMKRFNNNVANMGLAGGAAAATQVDTTPQTAAPPTPNAGADQSTTPNQPPGSTTPGAGGAQGGASPREGHPQAVEKGVHSGIAKKLQEIESAFGGRLNVTSGYRDSAHNARVGGAKDSAHTRGNAVDVTFNGGIPETLKLIEAASKAGIGGIGVYRPGSVHLDTENRRAWGPSYGRDSVPQWAEAAIRAHETGQWGQYDASARGGEGGMQTAGMSGQGQGQGQTAGGAYTAEQQNAAMMINGLMGGMSGIGGMTGMMLSQFMPSILGAAGNMFGVSSARAAESSPRPQTSADSGSLMRNSFRADTSFEKKPEDVTSADFYNQELSRRQQAAATIGQTAVETTARQQIADSVTIEKSQQQSKMPENPPPPPPRQEVAIADQRGVYSEDGNDSWVSAIRSYILGPSGVA